MHKWKYCCLFLYKYILQVEKRVSKALGVKVKMDHAGTNVKLNISAKSISLHTVEGNHQVTNHGMPKISFASGGDSVSNIYDNWPDLCLSLEIYIDYISKLNM